MIGIDPLLVYLEKRLTGIPITSLPVSGPTEEHVKECVLPPAQQLYKLVAYADDVKPAISNMSEFNLIDNACTLLEKASGVKLHRDPAAGKVKFLALGRWKGTLTQEDIPQSFIRLSDHLDFLGVELRATFMQTRKANGEQIQTEIRNTLSPWRAGKFMPLTQRPFSANIFALSKVWFKCNSLNIRSQDVDAVNSIVKSWVYQDCLEKPNELVLFRSNKDGGLGLLNVRVRAVACLIKSFMETAADPQFLHSLFHQQLFGYYILDDKSLPDPGMTQYYDEKFFKTIRFYHDKYSNDIVGFSLRKWYTLLLEDQVLMHVEENASTKQLIPVRSEILSPDMDWPRIWKRLSLKGLFSEHRSFLFRLIHGMLPIQTRLRRFGMHEGQEMCAQCQLEDEDICHTFFRCPLNGIAGLQVLGWIQSVVPDLEPENAVSLNFGNLLSEEEELAVLFVISVGLKFIWDKRVAKKAATVHQTRSQLEAVIAILRKASKTGTADLIERMLLK